MRAKVLAVAFAGVSLTGCAFITRASVPESPPLGVEGNKASERPSLSQTGRFVAFDSLATNLVSGDTNSVADVFVRNNAGAHTERVSVASDQTQANGASRSAAISDNGRFVAFETDATNLLADDTDGKTDVVLRDRLLGTTTVVSVDSSENPIVQHAVHPAISGNGRFVAFHQNVQVGGFCCLLTGPFVRDLVAGTTTAMPNAAGGSIATGEASLSDDGSRIAYGQFAPIPGTDDASYGTVVADTAGATVVATIDSGTLFHQFANYFDLALSGDGNKVAYIFASAISGTGTLSVYDLDQPGLVPILTGLQSPFRVANSDDGSVIALRVVESGMTRYVVTDAAGAVPKVVSANAGSTPASFVDETDLSGNGRWVAFATADPGMVAGDTNGVSDVFVRSVGPSLVGPS